MTTVEQPTVRASIRERTRAALLRAGVDTLVRNPLATLSDVADAAGVSRATLHRYFIDRPALVAAIEAVAIAAFDEAIADARLAEGTGLGAIRRLTVELIARLDTLIWWFGTAHRTGPDGKDANPQDEPYSLPGMVAFRSAIERGIEDGSIDPEMTPAWIETVMSSILIGTHLAPEPGYLSVAEARAAALRTIQKALAPVG